MRPWLVATLEWRWSNAPASALALRSQNYCKIETSLKSINNATKSKTHQNAHFGTHASTGCEGKFKNSKHTPVAAAPE